MSVPYAQLRRYILSQFSSCYIDWRNIEYLILMLPLQFHNIAVSIRHWANDFFVRHSRAGELFFPSLAAENSSYSAAWLFIFSRPIIWRELTRRENQNGVPPHKRNTGMAIFQNTLQATTTAIPDIACYGLRAQSSFKAEREQRASAAEMVRSERAP